MAILTIPNHNFDNPQLLSKRVKPDRNHFCYNTFEKVDMGADNDNNSNYRIERWRVVAKATRHLKIQELEMMTCRLKRSLSTYSSRKWMWGVCCLMKQNCYFQRGVAECRHATTPLSSYCINTTLQGFQKRYITLLYLKGLKSYQLSKFKCLHFTPLP